MHIDQVGARVEVVAPDLFENHHASEYLACVAHQELQQLVFRGQQAEGLIAPTRLVADQVQFQVGNFQHGVLYRAGVVAPQQHLHPCGHFVGGEGFGQVIVATGTQAAYALVHIGERADHQYRRGHADTAQGGDDGQAIEFGEHAVQGDHVVVAANGLGQTFTAIGDPVDVQAVAAEFGDDFLGGHGIVFDCQYAVHGGTCKSGSMASIVPRIGCQLSKEKFICSNLPRAVVRRVEKGRGFLWVWPFLPARARSVAG
ncbi:hypothetical protein D9M71_66470 [compost metagenome]